ncbi:MAG: hypothetical protein A4E58_02521 [Syntrophorhabdus sp. PtaB.Bin006]|nr:MAG: hypothetical protein A4E58_02521 [Syntrophorhabdus sp. PtaB.Bin006]
MPCRHRFQEGGAEDRRQDQSDNHGQEHGGNDGHGKLAIDDPRRPAEKGHGAEDRRKDKTDTDQGARDLFHGLSGGFLRRKPFLAHDPFHVFHDDDRVVHQKTDGEDHCEHGQHIDGKTEKLQGRKGPKEHHRHRNSRYQGSPDIPHKKPHDKKNQEDGLKKSLDYLVNRYPDKGGSIVGIDNLHPVREVLAHLLHFCLYCIGSIQGIGPCCLPDGHAGRRSTVVKGLDIVGIGSQLCPSHIFNAHDRTIRIDTDGNGGKLLRGLQHTLNDDRCVQALALHRRRPAELAGGHLHVVRPERCNDIFKSKAVINQSVRVEPETHGILGPEVFHLTHTGHPGQYLFQVRLGIVPQVITIHAAVFRDQAHNHEVVSGGFADGDTLTLNRLRQARHGEL